MSILDGFKIFKNGIDNWFSVALNMFVLKREVTCKIKNIGEVKLKKGVNYLNNSLFRALVFSNTKDLSEDQYEILKSYLPQLENDVIRVINYENKNELKFHNKEMTLIFESFLYGDYVNIPSSGDDNNYLIDIGGNVGDSALYFADKGYNVVALEPVPPIYDIAIKNISLNPELKDKITFINKACSCKRGVLTISFDENDTGGAGQYADASNQVDVDTITIEDIIKDFNIEPNILKIDCEGCEVNIIKYSDLSMFKQIIFEYHTNMTGFDENKLIEILENQGFKKESQVKFKNDGMGIVHMIK